MRKDALCDFGLAVLLLILVFCLNSPSPAKAVGLDRHHVCIGLGCKPCETDRHGHMKPGVGCERNEPIQQVKRHRPAKPVAAPKHEGPDIPLQDKCRYLQPEEADSESLKIKCKKAGYPTPYWPSGPATAAGQDAPSDAPSVGDKIRSSVRQFIQNEYDKAHGKQRPADCDHAGSEILEGCR